MKRYFLLLIAIIWSSQIFCFDPEIHNFGNRYQYELYLSWLEKGDFNSDFPAGFTKEKVVKTFADSADRKIEVEYDLKKTLINNQREILPFVFILDKKFDISQYENYLESFIYRLNAVESKFVYDFFDLKQVGIKYSDYSGKTALDVLIRDYTSQRIKVLPIELDLKSDKLGFIIPTSKGKTLKLYFAADIEIDDLLQQIQILEVSKALTEKEIIPPKNQELDLNLNLNLDLDLDHDPKSLSLTEYIKKHFDNPPKRELLHNKISQPERFLQTEFPNYKLIADLNKFLLLGSVKNEKLFSDIRVELVEKDDGIYFKPSVDHKLIHNDLILNEREKIDLSNLPQQERNVIASFLPQLIYEHRTLGSKLLNFMLIHDGVPTTLIIKNSEREVFELESYADLLLLLGKYWLGREIFFSIVEITRKNGDVEMKGFLIAQNEEKQDLAEIKFLVNKEHQIDLIMFTLHTKD